MSSSTPRGRLPNVPRSSQDEPVDTSCAAPIETLGAKAAGPTTPRPPFNRRRLCEEANLTRVLFHSYHFPPIGGSGAQRPLKMVRMLGELGYESIVVTSGG